MNNPSITSVWVIKHKTEECYFLHMLGRMTDTLSFASVFYSERMANAVIEEYNLKFFAAKPYELSKFNNISIMNEKKI
jgi:hypothetical protein